MTNTEPAASGYEPETPTLLKRKIILTLDQSNGENLKVGIDFDPPIVMPNNPEFAAMSDQEKGLQNYAAHVANVVMDALQTEEGARDDTAK